MPSNALIINLSKSLAIVFKKNSYLKLLTFISDGSKLDINSIKFYIKLKFVILIHSMIKISN